MNAYEFTLNLAGPDITEGENFDLAVEATEDLATFGRRGNVQYALFDLEASSFPDAVQWAFERLDDLIPGLHVTEVEPEDYVTAAEVARRTGRTRQNISQFVKGQRGSRDFPAPIALVGSSPLWSWRAVSRWFAEDDPEQQLEEELKEEWTATLNGHLAVREHHRALQEQVDRLKSALTDTEERVTEKVFVTDANEGEVKEMVLAYESIDFPTSATYKSPSRSTR